MNCKVLSACRAVRPRRVRAVYGVMRADPGSAPRLPRDGRGRPPRVREDGRGAGARRGEGRAFAVCAVDVEL